MYLLHLFTIYYNRHDVFYEASAVGVSLIINDIRPREKVMIEIYFLTQWGKSWSSSQRPAGSSNVAHE